MGQEQHTMEVPASGSVVCAQCGVANPPTRHFCRGCAAELASQAPRRAVSRWWRDGSRPGVAARAALAAAVAAAAVVAVVAPSRHAVGGAVSALFGSGTEPVALGDVVATGFGACPPARLADRSTAAWYTGPARPEGPVVAARTGREELTLSPARPGATAVVAVTFRPLPVPAGRGGPGGPPAPRSVRLVAEPGEATAVVALRDTAHPQTVTFHAGHATRIQLTLVGTAPGALQPCAGTAVSLDSRG